jgi:hypothetical protein
LKLLQTVLGRKLDGEMLKVKIYNIENKGFVKTNYPGGDFGCTD